MEFEMSVSVMLKKAMNEQKIQEQQREKERYEKLFADIAEKMRRCSSSRIIRSHDISSTQSKISTMLLETKLGTLKIFQLHIKFVEHQLGPYLEQIRREFRTSHARKLEFNLPEDIVLGLEFICRPIETQAI